MKKRVIVVSGLSLAVFARRILCWQDEAISHTVAVATTLTLLGSVLSGLTLLALLTLRRLALLHRALVALALRWALTLVALALARCSDLARADHAEIGPACHGPLDLEHPAPSAAPGPWSDPAYSVKDALRFSTQQNKTLDTITAGGATSRSVFRL
jgi:hypothetical protein